GAVRPTLKNFAHVAPPSPTPSKTATPLFLMDVADLTPPNPYLTITNVSNLPGINPSPTTVTITVLETAPIPDLVRDLVPTLDRLAPTTQTKGLTTIMIMAPLQLSINPGPIVKAVMLRTPTLLLV